ncbi:hypothetical protein L195_g039489, partial [Trifolium pratense]
GENSRKKAWAEFRRIEIIWNCNKPAIIAINRHKNGSKTTTTTANFTPKHRRSNKTPLEQQNPLKATNCQICWSDEFAGATNSSITGSQQTQPELAVNNKTLPKANAPTANQLHQTTVGSTSGQPNTTVNNKTEPERKKKFPTPPQTTKTRPKQ